MQVAKFEFALTTDNSFGLPDFKGSTFRGKFGHVLKRSICVMQHRHCPNCELREKCAYPYLFETLNERGENVPRPFVLEPPLSRRRHYLKDERMYLRLTLIGKAIDYLPYFVYCFDRMGKEGIGQDHGRYTIESVAAIDLSGEKHVVYRGENQQLTNGYSTIDLSAFTPTLQPQVTLNFLTPAQIKTDNRTQYEPDFTTLLKNILRRYKSLQYYHGKGDNTRIAIDWAAAEHIETVFSDTEERHFKRFSNRQKRPVRLDGFVGNITYRGDLAPFMPWLKIGEYLHVGKGAVFGMGWYRIVG